MAKTAAERQRERRMKLKKSGLHDQYKQKATAQKQVLRKKKLKTESAQEKILRQEKDRINHAKYRVKLKEAGHQSTSPNKAFGNSRAFGKAVSHVKRNLPNSPRKCAAVVQKLALQYSPKVPRNPKWSHGNIIDDITKEAVTLFYANDSISTQAPGLRDFFILRDDKGKSKIQKRYLQFTLGEVYRLFLEDNPSTKIGFSKFADLRPKHICLRSKTPDNMCLCIYHENIRLLLESSSIFPNSTTDFIRMIVCDDNSKSCMLQTCDECKDLKLFNKLMERICNSELESEVSYQQWIKSEEGALVRNKKEGILNDVLHLLEQQLLYFLCHVYVKRTQSKFFTNLKTNLPHGKLLIQIDFSENYSHIYQDEIQSAHWQNTSSTIYTSMVYYCDRESVTVFSEPYVVISDYGNHDKYAVTVFNNLIIEKFMLNHPEFKVQEIEFQSDGTSQHFKQKYTIFSMTQSKLPTVWHFSATSHGKGCIDGIGGTIKRQVRDATRARNIDPRTPCEFAEAAKKICPGINVLYESQEKMQRMKANLDLTWQEIKTMPGTRNSHCFRSHAPGIIFYSLTSECKKGTLFNFNTGECTENYLFENATAHNLQCGQ